ncbi:MAG: hypothetical protein MJ050_00725 [Phascolarctobacterium sp.]|nr:hypothetical protein [Phascolarctobacterium sp.]
MLTAEDFEKLGFWEDTTPEENITIYGMDFDKNYVTLTDVDGKTPVEPKKAIIMAAYDDNSCFLWFREFKNFKALAEVCAQAASASDELFQLFEAESAK